MSKTKQPRPFKRPRPKEWPPAIKYPLEKLATARMMWTAVALTHDMTWVWAKTKFPNVEDEPFEYSDRIQSIMATAEVLERFFLEYGPHGTDQIDPYFTLDFVSKAMVERFRAKRHFKLTIAEVWDCLDWHDPK